MYAVKKWQTGREGGKVRKENKGRSVIEKD
jgi:hypothetical protein